MKLNRFASIFTAAVLAFLTAAGGMAGFAQAFSLTWNPATLMLCCAAAALFCAAAFSFRRGGIGVLCILALLGGYFWRQGDLLQQIMVIAYRISRVYDSAYHCGIVVINTDPGMAVTLALCVLGCLIVCIFSYTVCGRRCAWLAVITALLPLIACLAVTNILPDSRYLYMLLLGLALLVLTQTVRRRSDRDGVRLTWLLAAPTALALSVLFLAIPRDSYTGQQRAAELSDRVVSWATELPAIQLEPDGKISLNLTGDSPASVSLRAVGPKFQSQRKVMEVTSETGGTLYLRGRDYNVYDGTRWTSTALRSEDFAAASDLISPEDAGLVTIRTTRSSKYQYVPYYPRASVALAGGALPNKQSENDYSWQRTVLPEDWETTAHAYWQNAAGQEAGLEFPVLSADDPVADYHTYTMLPEKTKQWAHNYLDNHLNLPDMDEKPGHQTILTANAIADLVRQSAVYDLDTARMPREEEDFARWFLESSDTGYCVHFATAATVLLRAAGIKARYVEGYLVSAPAGQTVTVTSDSAHAWAEYYVPEIGWVVLEATAAAADSTPVWVPAETAPASPETPTATDTQPHPTEDPVPEIPKPDSKRAAGFPVISALILLGIIGQWRLRLAIRKKKQQTGTPNQQALAKWQHTQQLCRLLRQQPPESLEALALRARFSQHTLTRQELAAFDSFCAGAVITLRSHPLPVRLYHRLIRAAY